MSLIYSYSDLQAIATRWQCCAADLAYKALQAEMYGHKDVTCKWQKFKFIKRASFILRNYIPNGTLLEEGYVSDALIDLATVTTGNISGAIVVDGQVIGIVPEGNYATIDDVIAAIVTAVNTHVPTTGFTATNNFDYTITISAPPGSGDALNNSTVTVVINPLYAVETLIDQRNPYVCWHATYVYDSTHPLYGTLFIACLNGPVGAVGKLMVIRDGVVITELIDAFTPRHFTIAFNKALDKLYTPDFAPPGLLRFRDLVNPTYTSAPTSPPIYHFLHQHTTYGKTDEIEYTSNSGGNIYRVDNTGASLATLAVGVGTTFLEVDEISGNIWGTNATDVLRINKSTGAVLTTIAGVNARRLFYYDGNGTPANARMFIPAATGNVVHKYNLDGTPDTLNWATCAGTPVHMTYNATFNHFFVATSNGVEIFRADGTLKQIVAFPSGQIYNDPKNNKIYAIRDATSGADAIAVIHYTNSGSQEFEETLTNGIPNTYMEDGDQCLTEEQIKNILEQGNKFCCNSCYSDADVTRDI